MKNKILPCNIIFIIFFLFININKLCGQTLYWTNASNDNKWSTPSNWSIDDPSIVINPSPSVSPPTTSTDVVFNSGSFKNPINYNIIIDSDVQARNMNVSSVGLANQVTVTGSGTLSLFGSISLLPEVSKLYYNATGDILFRSNNLGNQLSFSGQVLECNLVFNGVGGGWIFSSPFKTISSRGVNFVQGNLDFNGLTYDLGFFSSTSGSARSLSFGSSNFNLLSDIWQVTNAGFTSLSGTPSLNFFGNATITHLNTGINNFHYGLIKVPNGDASVSLNTSSFIDADITELQLGKNFVLGGFNVYVKKFVASYGSTAALQNSRLIVDEFLFSNISSCESYRIVNGFIVFTNSSTLAQPISRLWLDNVTAQKPNGSGSYILASPLIQLTESKLDGINNGWDTSNNVITSRSLYWIGNSGEWHNPQNWSLSSGGLPLSSGDCPPRIFDNVFFDENSFNSNSQTLTIDTSIDAFCNNMTWSGLDVIDVDWQGTRNIHLGGSIVLDPNMKQNITFNRNIFFYNNIQANVDFKNGTQRRSMPSVTFYLQSNAKVFQVSEWVKISLIRMDRIASRTYNIGGNSRYLEVTSIYECGTINMNDANIINNGNNLAIYYSPILIFNNNSRYYAEGSGTITHRFVSNQFPTFTQTNTNAFLSLDTQGSNLNVIGDLTINGRTNGIGNATITGFIKLSNNVHSFSDGTTIKASVLYANGTQCGVAPKIKSINGGKFNLNIPNYNVFASFASISDVNYIGDSSPLNLNSQGANDNGNNINIEFGIPISYTYYWRKSNLSNSFTGNWNNATHWTKNVSDIYGQTDPNGCIPTINDFVIFDNLSSDGSVVKVTISDLRSAKSLKWIDSGLNAIPNNMTFEILNTGGLDIKDELILANNMIPSFNGSINFVGSSSNPTHIDFKNKSVNGFLNINSGIVILDNSFVGSSRLRINSGEFNSNSKNFTAGTFWSTTNTTRKINITNSTVTLNSQDQSPGSNSFASHYIWRIQNSLPNLEFLSDNSTINMKGNFGNSFTGEGGLFSGDGLTYNNIYFSSQNGLDNNVLEFYGDNNIINGTLSVLGTLYSRDNILVNKLDLKTNRNHKFLAGKTTTFLPNGNIQKNGDLSAILNLQSSSSPSLHNFIKNSGGNIFVCNIGVIDIQASGVAFKTNSVSTYNGIAGVGANPPIGTSWNFNASVDAAEFSFTDLGDIHINLGDNANIGYQISQNNTGPYNVDIDVLGNLTTFNLLSSGNTVTNGSVSITPLASGDIIANNFTFFNCPGVYDPGVIIDNITSVKVPPVNVNGLALNGEQETYPFSNLSNKIFIMNESDRILNTSTYSSRRTQILVQDKVNTSDIFSLGDVTAKTNIDPIELNVGTIFYAKRRWSLSNTGSGGAIVRFYINQTELASLKSSSGVNNPDLFFLSSLAIYKFNYGVIPSVGQVGVIQEKLNSGVASELYDGINTYYFIEVKISDLTGSYALGTSLCYKPAITSGVPLDSKFGITGLKRAGNDVDNWPMIRKGSWLVLESKSKGLVINRLSTAQINSIPIGKLVEGMIVYDINTNSLKIYTTIDNGNTFGWYEFNTQTCPN